jgi:hypothetical protein
LAKLPSSLSNLTSLEFNSAGSNRASSDLHQALTFNSADLHLQLLPGNGCEGMLAAVKHSLKRLRLYGCVVRGGDEALHTGLHLLPGLEHLSIWKPLTEKNHYGAGIRCTFDAGSPSTLRRLLQLTSLEVGDCELRDRAGLQHLTGLTRLQELRLAFTEAVIGATGLSTLQLLTRLEVGCSFDPAMLEGLSQLQHLELQGASIMATATVAQLLSGLQGMHQLTRLNLARALPWRCTKSDDVTPRATAYAALTASSMLQYLDISGWTLPTTAWTCMFADRRLPHMRTIVAKGVMTMRTDGRGQFSCPAEAPEMALLVSCCPRLASLQLRGLSYAPVQMAQLQRLTGLRELHLLEPAGDSLTEHVLNDVCSLTRLRDLRLGTVNGIWDKMMRLTQLQQLTLLRYGNERQRHQPVPLIEFRQVSRFQQCQG